MSRLNTLSAMIQKIQENVSDKSLSQSFEQVYLEIKDIQEDDKSKLEKVRVDIGNLKETLNLY